MNIVEAVKSSKPYKRRADPEWSPNEGVWREFGTINLSYEDVLADDWEIKEPEVTITKSSFWEAHARALKAVGTPELSIVACAQMNLISRLVIELGLE